MTEEQVTKALLQYLTDNGWHIVCFDFPQSGTGRVLHPNNADGEKNKDSIIPDIVAIKNNISLLEKYSTAVISIIPGILTLSKPSIRQQISESEI